MTAAADNVRSIQGERHPTAAIPRFEGEEVVATTAKITSVSALEIGDQVFRIDQVVRLVVEARVSNVSHKVQPDGGLVRVHTMQALDSVVINWNTDLDALRDGLK